MGRKSKAKFTMKGHTLPGINQKSETVNLKDGRSPSSAFQMKEVEDSPLEINWKRLGKGILTGGLSEVARGFGKKSKARINPNDPDAGNEDAEAGKELLKEEAKESMEEESGPPMKSPTKKKLKTGSKTTVGGKLNEGTSPHQKL